MLTNHERQKLVEAVLYFATNVKKLGKVMRHFETPAQPTDEDVFAAPVKLERVPIFE